MYQPRLGFTTGFLCDVALTLGKSVKLTVKPSTVARYSSCCLGRTADWLLVAGFVPAFTIDSAVGDEPGGKRRVLPLLLTDR